MRKAHAIAPGLLVLATMATTLGGPAAVASTEPAERPLQFKPEIEASPPGTPAPIPRMWLGIVPETLLDDFAIAQLSAAVRKTLTQREDGRFFAIQVEEGLWQLEAETAPRDELAEVYTEPYLGLFLDCIRSLEPDVELSHLVAILYGSTPREGWLEASRMLVEEMIANLGRNGCSAARNTIELKMERLRTITRSMLSDRFSLDDYTEGEIVILTSLLNPLFFGKHGFWSRSRLAAFKEILIDSFSNHLLTSAQFRAASETTYTTFLDFVTDTILGRNPGLVTDFLLGAAILCLPREATVAESLYEPFSLGRCLEEERAYPLLFRVDGEDYILIGGARP